MTARRITRVGRAFKDDGEISDEALLAGIAHRDERAVVAFVRRYQRRIFGLALSLVGDSALAEEIAQEAMLRVWRHAAIFDPRRGAVSTWVLTITRNLAVDALRMRRAAPMAPEAVVELLDGPSLDGELAQLHTAEVVRAALAAIPEPQRRAIVLATLYGYSAQEVSVAEAIPLGTAKSRIRLGLNKLREVMVEAEL
jgi:RNA polymerase sigma-70 factor (ECF subfamily)